MKLWLAEPWKARVRYLRPYYANWKPQQRDHPVNTPDVWYLPLVWTSWCTVMAAIILLALCLGDMMDTFLTVQHLNFALYLNSPLIVIWWRFAVLMSERESNSRYYKSKQRHCNCSMCSHHLMRNGCVVTRLYNGKVPVTMVIPRLKHKCCQRRRVKFIVCKPESTRVISLLLMLAGDVESNPGPEFQEYVSLLPTSVHGYLKETLDWDNDGVDKDLNGIAARLSDWEVKLSVPFQFKQHEIHDLKEKHSDPVLLRRAVLRLWKEKQGLHSTYENLLKVCCEAGATRVAQAICDVLKQRAKDYGKLPPKVSVKSQIQAHEESVHSSSSEHGTQVDDPDSKAVVKFPAFPQGDLREEYFAQLKSQTKKIRIFYVNFSMSFMKNFLKREKNGDADFNELFVAATNLFDFEDSEDLMAKANPSKNLLLQVLKRQSYMNFELLKALIAECGTEEDEEAAQKYSDAFAVYAKRRVFECDPDAVSSELPGHDMVMFVLDKNQSFKLVDANDFRYHLSELLGMKYQKIIVHKFEPGSIVMYVLIPSKYIRALTTVTLYCDRVLTLQSWNTRCIKFKTQEPVHLDGLKVLNSVNFNEVILNRNKVKMTQVGLEGAEYIALEYTESFCDESSADTGYIEYMNSLLSKKHRNLPAVKGVHYRFNPEEENRQYPTIVIENLKPLKDAVVEEEMSQVNQVSLLLDVANSVASFKHDTPKHKVLVCTDAILVQESLSESEARFCPLYGLSFVSNISQSRDPESNAASIPLVELQWMSDVVKFIHFKGSVSEQVDLPENHVLKKMFDQKWLSVNDRFRPLNYKILCDEIENLLETEKTWVGLVAGFSDDPVEDEVQIHLILIGHTGVGKTSLRKHLKDKPIDMNETPTIVMEPEFLYRESVELLAANPFKCIKDVLSSSNSKVFLTMWDTGGQPIFQDLLPCFARLKCMYGIVFRLPDLQEFDSRPEIRPCDEHHESVISPFSNKDILYRNLAYVQAYSCSMKEKFENLPIQANPSSGSSDSSAMSKFPAAVVVGTCKDKSGDFDPLAVNETKLSLDRGIGEFVHNNNVSVYPVPHISSYIHEIDNTVSGRYLDEGISHLRDNISRCAQESSTKVHKSWKIFELKLKRLIYTKYVNLGIVPLIEAIALGKECKVDNPRAALMYFHELGVFMWYHMSERESMKNFVVIDPKTLLQILSKVYCFDPGSIPPELKPLLDKGMMTIDFFICLLKQKASNIDDSWFMSFLEEHHLSVKIIHPGQDIRYFLPSLLPITPNYEDNLDQLSSRVSPLYIVPQSSYIPTGMFTRLLTALAGVTYGSTVWRIPLEDAHMPHVCRNQFEFVINDSLHLILSEFSRHIRIDCVSYKSATIDESLYFHIASTIDVQLQRIVPRWMEEREFTFTFACKNSFCLTFERKLHFLTDKDMIFKTNQLATCSNGIQTPLLPSETVWLRKQLKTTNESASVLFEEALQEGVLDINMASIMFVGIDSPGSTSAKHLVFQEAVPTTYKATLLVNHEIYFKAEGDPTLKKLQPDTCTDVMLMSHCLSKSPVVDDSNTYSSLNPSSLKDPPQIPTTTKSQPRPTALNIQSSAEKHPLLFRPSAVPPADHDNSASQTAAVDNPVISHQDGQPLVGNLESVQADLKGTPVDLEDNEMRDVTGHMSQTTVKAKVDTERTVLQLANMDNFTKYMTQLKDKGVVEFYHVFDCGSHLLHMREILKIFIRNVSLCVLATDLSSDLQQEELSLLTENEGFASRGLIIGTHSDLLHGTYSESSNAELKRLHESGFIIKDETSQLNLFPMNCKQPDYEIAASIVKHSSLTATRKKFPFAWYVFGFKLRQVMAGLNRSTLSVSNECMIIAKELNMDRPTVEAALTHLTEQNMILYFRDTLPDSVFAGVNIFSQLFSLLYSNKCKEQNENVWQFSIVSESHLKTVVDYVADGNVSVTDFILLFEKLLILSPYDGTHASYLMPCLLPILDEVKVNEIHDCTISVVPVCINCPSSGYEFITMLASCLLTQTSHEWTVALNLLGAPVCLYKNCLKFMIESSQCFVNLSFFNSFLRVSIVSFDNKPVVVREILNAILYGLERVKIVLNVYKTFDFKVSFCCPCGSPDYEHTATYNRDQKTITCDIRNVELSGSGISTCYEKWLTGDLADVNKYSEILTVRNIVKKLAAWSNKWISIAEHLEVPSAVISTIRVITTHQQSKDTALYRVVEWWFANNPNPEWLTIDSVIVELEANDDSFPKMSSQLSKPERREEHIQAYADDEWNIPFEIIKLGDKAVAGYRFALAEGRQKIPYSGLLVLGEEEVGKTSLLRQLLDMKFLPDLERTRGIDNNAVSTLDSRSIDAEKWCVEKSEGASVRERFDDAVLGVVIPELSSASDQQTQSESVISTTTSSPLEHEPREDIDPHPDTAHSDMSSRHQNSSARTAQPNSTEPVSQAAESKPASPSTTLQISPTTTSKPLEPSYAVLSAKQMSKIDKMVKGEEPFLKKEPLLVLNTLDFAGQPEYKPMHHCYISLRALFIVVFMIPDMLNFLADPGKAKRNPLDSVSYWIRSIGARIHSAGDSNKVVKQILLVGTHLGDPPLPLDELLKIDRYLKSELIEISTKRSQRYVNFIHLMDSELECFIPVENSIDYQRGGSYRQDSGIKLVQDTVMAMSKSLPFLNEEYPIKWLKLEERIKLLHNDGAYEEGDPAPIMDVQELKDLAKKCGIDSDEQQELALDFFNSCGKIIYLKHIPRLFLSAEEYKKLAGLVILTPHWMMSMMKVIMELSTKKEVKLSTQQILKLVQEGVADSQVLEACWRKFVPPSDVPSLVTIEHLSLLFKAYGLIHPLCSHSQPAEFLIPSKMPEKIKDSTICRVVEQYTPFYFDFNGFLPDVVYHRLVCLMSTISEPLHPDVHNHYSKQRCFFSGIMGTNFITEMDESKQRLRIGVKCRKQCDMVLYDYLYGMHEKFLSKICEDSGLGSLEYFGGPEVTCPGCQKVAVIPCLTYKGGKVTKQENILYCHLCEEDLGIKEWLPQRNTLSSSTNDPPAALPTSDHEPQQSAKPQSLASCPKLKHLQLIKWKSPAGAIQKYHLVNHVSARWRKFGLRIDLTKNQMENWAKETDNEECWERVMDAWLEGQGQDEYPPTWEGLYMLLEDVQLGRHVTALKEAVESARLQGNLA